MLRRAIIEFDDEGDNTLEDPIELEMKIEDGGLEVIVKDIVGEDESLAWNRTVRF